MNISRNRLLVFGAGVAWAAGIGVPLSPTARLLGVSEDRLMSEDRLHIVSAPAMSAMSAVSWLGLAVRAVVPALAKADADADAHVRAQRGCLRQPRSRCHRDPRLPLAARPGRQRSPQVLARAVVDVDGF